MSHEAWGFRSGYKRKARAIPDQDPARPTPSPPALRVLMQPAAATSPTVLPIRRVQQPCVPPTLGSLPCAIGMPLQRFGLVPSPLGAIRAPIPAGPPPAAAAAAVAAARPTTTQPADAPVDRPPPPTSVAPPPGCTVAKRFGAQAARIQARAIEMLDEAKLAEKRKRTDDPAAVLTEEERAQCEVAWHAGRARCAPSSPASRGSRRHAHVDRSAVVARSAVTARARHRVSHVSFTHAFRVLPLPRVASPRSSRRHGALSRKMDVYRVIVTVRGRIVGWLKLLVTAHEIYSEELVVADEAQGMGLGYALFAAGTAFLQARGTRVPTRMRHQVTDDNDPALHMYDVLTYETWTRPTRARGWGRLRACPWTAADDPEEGCTMQHASLASVALAAQGAAKKHAAARAAQGVQISVCVGLGDVRESQEEGEEEGNS